MKITEFRKLLREEIQRALKEVELLGDRTYIVNGKKIFVSIVYTAKDDAIEDLSDLKNAFYKEELAPLAKNITLKNKILQQLKKYPDNMDVALAKDGDSFRLITPEEVKQIVKLPEPKTLRGRVPANTLLLILDEDNIFSLQKLKSYNLKSSLDLSGQLIPTKDVANYPQIQGTTPSPKWKATVAKLGNKYEYYDVLMDGGENCVVAAVPKQA